MASFRFYIDSNKKKIVEFLKGKDYQSTDEIRKGINEREVYDVRTAIKELEKEGVIESEIRYVNSKYYKLIDQEDIK